MSFIIGNRGPVCYAAILLRTPSLEKRVLKFFKWRVTLRAMFSQ
jgi:hypothetical protein